MRTGTAATRPSATEGWASVGAGNRVRATDVAGLAYDAEAPLEGGTAREAAARRVVGDVPGDVVVVGAPAGTRANAGKHLTSLPGALGQALHDAGKRTAVVGNADDPAAPDGRHRILRPAADGDLAPHARGGRGPGRAPRVPALAFDEAPRGDHRDGPGADRLARPGRGRARRHDRPAVAGPSRPRRPRPSPSRRPGRG